MNTSEDETRRLKELRRIWRNAMERDSTGTYTACAHKAAELREKHGVRECEACRLYHILGGSTPGKPLEVFDLEGEIERFIREELDKEGRSERKNA